MKTKFLIIFCFLFFIGCASKVSIPEVDSSDARKLERNTHSIDLERLSHSIAKGVLIESVHGGVGCAFQQGWAVGGMDSYSRGPGVPLYPSQAENDAMGLKRPDLNFVTFKAIEDTLKNNNIKISSKSDLKLSALVVDIKVNTCLEVVTFDQKGEAYYKIRWQLYSKTLKKDLFSKEIESYSIEENFGENNSQKVVVDAHKANTNKLINDEDFRKLIDANNFYIGTDENSI